MNAVVYLFQVSACMGIFYLFYYLLLNRYTFFTINRWYLIITLAISFIIPLLTITVQHQDAYPQVIKQVVYINQMQTPQPVLVTNEAPAQVQINWMALVRLIYMVAVTGLLIRLLLIVVKFFTRIKNTKRTKIGGILIVKGDEELRNGSFFNYIFLNDDELSADELEQIIAHEMLHVKRYHSVDRMLVKIAQVFLWFNPFVYLYARAIEENHEFEVDRAVSSSTDRNKYAELLFHLSVAKQGTLYHNFSMVPLKKRITMLFTKPTNRMKKVIYLLVLPVVLISCLAFAKLKNEGSIKIKRSPASVVADTTVKVKYRQKSKLTPAQRKAQDEGFKKMQAYFESPEGKRKMALSESIRSKVITVDILGDYNSKEGMFRGKMVREKSSGNEFLLLSWYGQEKQLNSQLNKGDEVNMKIFGAGVSPDRPVTITPAYVIKGGKEIFRLVEAEKIPQYPFLYEANKVRFADGQITNITKYSDGKWKTAVFERVNGYKFNLSFKSDAPNLDIIKEGDHVTLRFIHEVKTGDKTYNIKDWVAISTDIKDYGIKNPEWFNKFYELVKADTGKISAINGIESLGTKPLVLINGTEYDKNILYKISMRGVKGTSIYPPNNGTTKYGDKAKDGAVIIDTRDGEINYLTDNEMQNIIKANVAKEKFFSRTTLTKEDGSKYDLATINRKSGTVINADVSTNGRIAFIINNKVYSEKDFKRLFPVDKASYGGGGGVYMGTKELAARGFKLDGYEIVFVFETGAGLKTTNAAERTGAIAPDNKGINKTMKGKPVLITGGSSDYSGRTAVGFTAGAMYKYKKSSLFSSYRTNSPSNAIFQSMGSNNNTTEDTKKVGGATVPEQKDTDSIKSLKQMIRTIPGVEIKPDGTLWVNNQPVKKALINGKQYMGGGVSQAINTVPAEITNNVKVTSTPKILVDGKEFIPVEGINKVKAANAPKILVDGKEFIPNNNDIQKKDLLNSIQKLKPGNSNVNDSLVATHFSGEVKAVKDIVGTKLVIIKNGDFFAAYSNLANVNVTLGQEVTRGQILGVASFNAYENKRLALFELYRNSNKITDKTEQETILKNFEAPKLNMVTGFKNMYAYFLPKTNH
ncbi:M56 family metallopeptidase [Mucilaginibacter sp. HD30]